MNRPAFAGCVRGLLAAILLVALLPGAAAGQEVGEPQPERDGFRLLERTLPVAEGARRASSITPWVAGGLGYQLTGGEPVLSAGSSRHVQIAATDLATGERIANSDPAETPHILPPVGADRFVAVDEDAGLVYVPHFAADPDPAVNRASCQPTVLFPPCMAGIYVLDARTLELRDDFDFRARRPDGTGIQLTPLAVEHAAPAHDGDPAKLYVLLQEEIHHAGEIAAQTDLHQFASIRWVAQIDARTGETDWLTRVQVCTGAPNSNTERPLGVVFRSPDPVTPVVWVACYGSGFANGWVAALDLDPADPYGPPVGQRRFAGPPATVSFRADPPSQRILFKSVADNQEVWWVFDGRQSQFVAKLGVGPHRGFNESIAGLDPASGRFYVLAPDVRVNGDDRGSGGLFFTDLRRRDIPQFVRVGEFSDLVTTDGNNTTRNLYPLVVVPEGEDVRHVLIRPNDHTVGDNVVAPDHYLVLEDAVAISDDPPPAGPPQGRSSDVDERDGATAAAFSGSARGFGLRTILLGGATGLYQGPLSELGEAVLDGATQGGLYKAGAGLVLGEEAASAPPYASSCPTTDREVVFALAGAHEQDRLARIDHLGTATAQATPTYIDPSTRRDLANPASGCRPHVAPTWDQLTALADADGFDEPGAPPPDLGEAVCVAPERARDQHPSDDSDPLRRVVLSGFHASTGCDGGRRIEGSSAAKAVEAGPVSVAAARSTYAVERREDGGIQAHVESWVRGIDIVGEQGTIRLDAVRATAEVRATGRAQDSADVTTANCDPDRTAGTCLRRSVTGAHVISPQGEFTCDECTDEDNQERLVQAMQAALGSSWVVRFREPDAELAAGSVDGYEAAILKSETDRFVDAAFNHDLMPTVPALELVRVNNAPSRPGRQIYQFAGVEAATTYGITCFLVDEDHECTAEAASLRIELEDTDGQALEGGVFEVQADADGDGTISLEESTTPARTCVTAADGSCELDPIAAGSYVVQQTLAPTGFAPAPDTSVVLPAGGQGLIEVVNGRLATTGLRINLTDTADPPQPLAGGTFEVHADDGDGALGSGDVLLATCTTGATGACPFELAVADSVLTGTSIAAGDPRLLLVPAGPYVVHQSAAPDGYAPIDDVAFTLPEGQIADANFQNGRRSEQATPTEPTAEPTETSSSEAVGDVPPEQPPPAVDEPVQEPVAIAPPAPAPPPVVTVNVPEVPAQAPAVAPPAAQPSTIVRVLQAPAAAARLLLRSPLEAAAFGGVLLLFAAAGAGAWRRRLLLDLLSD